MGSEVLPSRTERQRTVDFCLRYESWDRQAVSADNIRFCSILVSAQVPRPGRILALGFYEVAVILY